MNANIADIIENWILRNRKVLNLVQENIKYWNENSKIIVSYIENFIKTKILNLIEDNYDTSFDMKFLQMIKMEIEKESGIIIKFSNYYKTRIGKYIKFREIYSGINTSELKILLKKKLTTEDTYYFKEHKNITNDDLKKINNSVRKDWYEVFNGSHDKIINSIIKDVKIGLHVVIDQDKMFK